MNCIMLKLVRVSNDYSIRFSLINPKFLADFRIKMQNQDHCMTIV